MFYSLSLVIVMSNGWPRSVHHFHIRDHHWKSRVSLSSRSKSPERESMKPVFIEPIRVWGICTTTNSARSVFPVTSVNRIQNPASSTSVTVPLTSIGLWSTVSWMWGARGQEKPTRLSGLFSSLLRAKKERPQKLFWKRSTIVACRKLLCQGFVPRLSKYP